MTQRPPRAPPAGGYRHDVVDTSPVRVGGETLAAYCARRLEEESVVLDTRIYRREYWPGVVPGDLVLGSLAGDGLDGLMRVRRQSLTCQQGIVVEEEAQREVGTWQRS